MTTTLETLRADFEAKRQAFVDRSVFQIEGRNGDFHIEGVRVDLFTLDRFLNRTALLRFEFGGSAMFEFRCVWPEALWKAANMLHEAEKGGMDAAMLWKLAN